MSSMVDGGKRLLNQISGGFSYEPHGEVRLVSHVFTRGSGKPNAGVANSKDCQ